MLGWGTRSIRPQAWLLAGSVTPSTTIMSIEPQQFHSKTGSSLVKEKTFAYFCDCLHPSLCINFTIKYTVYMVSRRHQNPNSFFDAFNSASYLETAKIQTSWKDHPVHVKENHPGGSGCWGLRSEWWRKSIARGAWCWNVPRNIFNLHSPKGKHMPIACTNILIDFWYTTVW